MRKQLYVMLAIVCASCTFFSCTKQDTTLPDTNTNNGALTTALHPIDSTHIGNTAYKLTMYRQYDSLFVGYNPLYFKLEDTTSHTIVSSANLHLQPMMDMITMSHSCPVDQPTYSDSSKLYGGAASFIMASMDDMGMHWTMPLSVQIDGTTYQDTLSLQVKSTASNIVFLRSFAYNDDTYYVALVHPWQGEQVVGLNPLEVAVYKKESLTSFPAVDGLTLSFIPTMPSMGHSSPNNVNPTANGIAGHYAGKVNFTMTGDWQLDFSVYNGTTQMGQNVYLNLYF